MSDSVKIVRSKVEEYHKKINELKSQKFNDKYFTFCLIKNFEYLELELQSINSLRQSIVLPDLYNEYQTKKDELFETVVKKKENGERDINIVDLGNGMSQTFINFKTVADREAFSRFDKELAETYKDAIAEYESIINSFMAVMSEEIELKIMKIPFKVIPDNVDYSDWLKVFIKETDEEIMDLLEKKYA